VRLRASAPFAAFRADRWSWIVAVIVMAAALASAVAGGPPAVATFLVGLPIVAAVVWALAFGLDRAFLVRLILIAFAVRTLAACVLHLILVSRGNPVGAMFQDDWGYTLTAGALARSWRAIPISSSEYVLLTDPSIANDYVVLLAGVLWATAGNIVAAKIVNGVVGSLCAVFVYRTLRNLGLPGAKLAAVGVAFFPTLVLWSLLTLKDAIALLAMLAVIWSISEYFRTGRRWLWLVTIAALLLIRDIRVYIFVILLVAWPLGLLLHRRRRAAFGALGIAAVLLVLSTDALGLLAPGVLVAAANTRSLMAEGARSAFVEPPPIARATPGQVFQVDTGSSNPDCVPRTIEVPPGTLLVVYGEPPPPQLGRGSPRPVAYVCKGDIISIVNDISTPRVVPPASGSGGVQTPAPSATTTPAPTPLTALRVQPDQVNVLSTPEPTAPNTQTDAFIFEHGVMDNLRHLPIGVLFLVAAPFPLTARTTTEIGLAPEMLLWYAALVLAVFGLVEVVRRRETAFATCVLAAGAIGLVLSLVEGNVGTLVRHRAMLVPFVVMLAAIGAVRSPAVRSWIERVARVAR
jgi:hypothetical protein